MKDFLLNKETKELEIANGDFVTGTSDGQHQELLLILEKGSLKEFPTACVGAAKYLEDEDVSGFLREVRTQFSDDGMEVKRLAITESKLAIDAPYKQ